MKKQIFTLAFALCTVYGYSQSSNTFPASGNVGVGTLDPTSKLDIVRGFTSAGVNLYNMAYFGFRTPFVQVGNVASNTGLLIQDVITQPAGTVSSKLQTLQNNNNAGFLEFNGAVTTNSTRAAITMGYNNVEAMRINQNGKVRIGSGASDIKTPDGYKLFVEQGILTEKVKVAVKTTAEWADYVFATEYKLMPLEQVELFTKENKHLPNLPSANDMVKEGLDVAKMDAKLLEKIEELTLYAIDQNNEAKKLKAELAVQKKEVEELKAQMKLIMQKQ